MEIPTASTATDTEEERLAEYQRLFPQAPGKQGEDCRGDPIRFRAEPGVEEWVRDLAAREKGMLRVPDDDMARAILDEFYALPDIAVSVDSDGGVL